jgi:hypothetical protein
MNYWAPFCFFSWMINDLKSELTFKDNSNIYWNSMLNDSIVLHDYHLKLLDFEVVLNIFKQEEINKLMLISNIEIGLTKKTINSLIDVAITQDYECRYAPSYAVDIAVFSNLIKFLDKFKIEDIYFWAVASRELEGHLKSEKYDVEFDIKNEYLTIYKYPLSDSNILDLKINDLVKFRNIEDILDSIK